MSSIDSQLGNVTVRPARGRVLASTLALWILAIGWLAWGRTVARPQPPTIGWLGFGLLFCGIAALVTRLLIVRPVYVVLTEEGLRFRTRLVRWSEVKTARLVTSPQGWLSVVIDIAGDSGARRGLFQPRNSWGFPWSALDPATQTTVARYLSAKGYRLY